MPDQIFISYRRDDAAYVTGHINDMLRKAFGDDAVFTDVDNIALGVDFRAVLDETVSQCQVLLAVIGSEWLTVRDQEGQLRLQDPADFVRIEIESALKRNIPVIPLLVAGAKMPAEEELPESLRALAFRNGIQIRPAPDFGVDMARLIKNLQQHFAAMGSVSEAGPGIDLTEGAGQGAEPERKETPAKPAGSESAAEKERAAPGLQFEVDEDDRARHRAELANEKRKTRKARITAVGLFGAAIAAAGSWYFTGNHQEEFRTLPPVSDPVVKEIEAPADPIEELQIAPPPDTDMSDEVSTEEEANAAAEAVTEEDATPDAEILADTAAEEPVNVSAGDLEAIPENVEADVDVAKAAATDAQPEDVPPVTESVRQPDVSEYIGEGVRLAAIGDYEAAILSFDEALKLNSEAAFVYKQRGAAYQATGDHAAAISDFDEAIRLNSEDMNAYYRRGVSNQALDNHAAAIADFDAVLAVDPEFVDAASRRDAVQEAMSEDGAATSDLSSSNPVTH
jgi:tetratricopeptide (TPR) repeat protein